MYNAYSIQHSFDLHHPHPCVLSQCPSHYCAVAFQDRCAQVFQIYGNRKLTDPQFQQKMWPISIHPCRYIKLPKCSAKTVFQTASLCLQTKAPLRSCAFVLRWRHCTSRAYQVKYNSYSCEPFRLPPLSLHAQSWYTSCAGKILSFTQCLPVRFFSLQDNLFYLFR